jgi:hypothetical protein
VFERVINELGVPTMNRLWAIVRYTVLLVGFGLTWSTEPVRWCCPVAML